jgi:hypothetical protein
VRQLVIEYLLEGHQRGYNYTSSTAGFNDDTLKSVWRKAMPRGQGWGNYTGARSLKSFTLEDGRVALSDVTVTPMRDESGRGGIRRAVIDVMQPGEYHDALQARFDRYPAEVRAWASKRLTLGQRRQIIDRSLPKMKGGGPQVIFAYPYAGPDSWLYVEALLLKLALSPASLMWRLGKLVTFTTLALEYREEPPLVALPRSRAAQFSDISTVELN